VMTNTAFGFVSLLAPRDAIGTETNLPTRENTPQSEFRPQPRGTKFLHDSKNTFQAARWLPGTTRAAPNSGFT
jgi:hypothetical protein